MTTTEEGSGTRNGRSTRKATRYDEEHGGQFRERDLRGERVRWKQEKAAKESEGGESDAALETITVVEEKMDVEDDGKEVLHVSHVGHVSMSITMHATVHACTLSPATFVFAGRG
jgi:hypothetical protein